ncbi:aspartate-alanine antiporter [Roseococcus sp. YIM B11640]|uniref:aspartate-alanine antiporter n=1 Tax=Roseococcus sp. YIM B11640 TaxID=3133973 RepID=UPI003C7BD846
MMAAISAIFVQHPELALFLSLGLGYAIGKLSYGSFTVGAVTGCLIAGVIVGQTGVRISGDVKQAFFLLFLFAIGYRTGPQFFRSLNAKALPQIAVTVILCVTALAVTLACALALRLDVGIAAGLMAGAATESATVGVAIDTFRRIGATPEAAHAFEANVATAFAVSYLVGVIATIIMLSQVAPRLLPRPLPEACAAMEEELGGAPSSEAEGQAVRHEVEARAFRIAPRWVGKTVAEAEAATPPGGKAYIEQVHRGDRILEGKPDLVLKAGDIAAIAGWRAMIVENAHLIGEEVDDRQVLDVREERVEVVVTKREVIGKTLAELRRSPQARAVFLRHVVRGGNEIPIYDGLTLERGDVLVLVGTRPRVAAAIDALGYADRPSSATDMVFVGLFIFLGGLLGIPALHLGALELSIGVAVGTLLGGLVAGWLRSRNRRFGFVPAGTLWFFDSVGLSAFIACVGISAGPSFVTGLVQSGPALVIVSIVVVVVAHGTAILVGSRVFRMNEGVLLGTCCGAGTSAPALAAVQEVAKSKIPTIGYGLGYAIGNVLLALWGSVIVFVMAASGS